MKKLILALAFGVSTAAFAQPDVAITLTSPANNSTITAGTAFNFDVTITNNGTEPIDANDSIIFAPIINNNYINSGGNPLVYLEQQAVPVGGSVNITRSLNLSGGSSGQLNFCGVVVMRGAGWLNVTESDATNNQSCNTVTYSSGTVSAEEFTVVSPIDESYFSNGVYHVRMSNQSIIGSTSLVVYNIAGAEVIRTELTSNGSDIDQDVNIEGLNKGIYLVEVQGLANRSVKKIVVQ